jgi:DNA invertase Pin-like site-specific DNA recombinase
MFNFSPCPLPPGSPVWAYLRDSGGDGQDLASQRAYVLGYCDHHNLILLRTFEDAAISGGSTHKRDEFELMIDLSRQQKPNPVKAILFWDLKRFARNLIDSQFYKADLRRRGYTLHSLSDDIPDSDISPILEAVLDWKAEKDRQDISKDVKRGLAFIISMKNDQGNYIGLMPGRPPKFFTGKTYNTGLKRNNGQPRIIQQWTPDPTLWTKGQQAFEMRANGTSYKQIEHTLNLFPKSPNPTGMYSSIFKNQIYIGRLIYSGQTYQNFVPALATPEQWAAVQARRHPRPQKGKPWPGGKHPRTGKGSYLLVGLCRCQYCGSAMHGNRSTQTGKTPRRYYACTQKKARPATCQARQIPAAQLEQQIIQTICSYILTFEFIADLVKEINLTLSDTEETTNRIEKLKKEIAHLNRTISNLIDLAEMNITPDIITRLKQQTQTRAIKQTELTHHQTYLNQQTIQVDETLIKTLLTETHQTLTQPQPADLKAQQLILKQTIQKIEISRQQGTIYSSFSLLGLWKAPPRELAPKPQTFKFSLMSPQSPE